MNDFNAPDDLQQELLTATKTGLPVQNRVANAASAFSIWERMKEDNRTLARMRAVIKHQYDGNSPIDQTKLNEQAQAWRSNVNFHQTKAIIDAAASTQWSMVMSTPTLASFKCLTPTGERALDYGAILAKVFTKMVREEWHEFSFQLMLRIKESLLYGNGPMFFRDEFNWKSEAVNAARIMVPRTTRSVEGGVEFCIIRDEISPAFLAEIVDNSKYASKEGWNISEVKNTLKQKYFEKGTPNRDSDEYRLSEWESYEQRRKNLSSVMPATAEFEPVACVHLLVEELDTKEVSHYLIFEDSQIKDAYLFEADRQYESMNNAIHFLLFVIQ
jgi:hypothetical protein